MSDESSYTPEEVAKILKISRFTVYELIKRGELTAYHIGRKVRVEPADLDRYKQNAKGCPPALTQATVKATQSLANLDEGLIICGQDMVLDILTRQLQAELPQLRFLRHYIGSIPGLLELYQGSANLVTAHLWDGDNGEYNTPYVRRLLPGQRTIIYNLLYRFEGFYVAKGNPKAINSWNDLTRSDVRFVNRECGSGARVLLDEQLRKLDIETASVQGYGHEETSHLAVASFVARGEADVGLGTEKGALQVESVDFIPLHKERYDLVMRKEDAAKPHFQKVIAILRSTAFRNEVAGLGGYDISDMGKLMAEL
ncbi:MAG TPA: excisionase [Firmicutes bacterium]|nr:excisionase [Bacillota bacterium]